MYPKKLLYNTAISVQQPFITGHSLSRNACLIHTFQTFSGSRIGEKSAFFYLKIFFLFWHFFPMFLKQKWQVTLQRIVLKKAFKNIVVNHTCHSFNGEFLETKSNSLNLQMNWNKINFYNSIVLSDAVI